MNALSKPAAILSALLLVSFAVVFPQGQSMYSGSSASDGKTLVWRDTGCAGQPCAVWEPPGGGGGVPAGAILLIDSGTCPSGFAEVATLDGRTLLGTLAANADVGGTGGADNITPAGSNSAPTFTGSALGTHAHGVGTYAHATPTFAGDPSTVVVNHVHVQNVNTGTTGGSTGYGVDTSTNGTQATAQSTANPTGGSASYTPTGTVSNPAFSGSSEAVSGGTPAGSVSAPTFTGTQFDNRSAFVKVIFCKKT